jgi:hypothetical protein
MEVIVVLIGALFGAGGIAAILKTRSDNKKTSAEAEVTLGGGWQSLWETARIEINELRERLAILEHEEATCKARLALLEAKHNVLSVEDAVAKMVEAEIIKRGGGVSGHGTVGGHTPRRDS